MGSTGFSKRPHNSSRSAEPLGVRIHSSYTVPGEDLWIEIFRDHGWFGAGGPGELEFSVVMRLMNELDPSFND
ncbi:MAG TPA: hypothetical protein DES72_15030 [Gammaproteobacteria bacterium]|nr:hypothetical protein [Acidiferrobacteraceae bacterium]HCF75076.1 hypothetical protein [Gammaproteobacteria bacterium]